MVISSGFFFAFTYFIAAYAGMAISDRSENITVIWIASGVALAGLLLAQPKQRNYLLGVILATCFYPSWFIAENFFKALLIPLSIQFKRRWGFGS